MNISEDLPIDTSEFGSEIPPVPEHYQEMVARWGGSTGSTPNVRIVCGTDPKMVQWCGGQWVPKYTIPEVEVVEYHLWHKPDGTKKILTPAEARVLQDSKKLNGILLPVMERKVHDWLIPRYFVEIYRGPEYFGDREGWEKLRMGKDEEGRDIDMMGDYPENGDYETWFCIEDLELDHRGEPVRSKFRALDDDVLEFIREQIETAKNLTMLEQYQQATEEFEDKKETQRQKFKETIQGALEERIDRIMDIPSTTRIK